MQRHTPASGTKHGTRVRGATLAPPPDSSDRPETRRGSRGRSTLVAAALIDRRSERFASPLAVPLGPRARQARLGQHHQLDRRLRTAVAAQLRLVSRLRWRRRFRLLGTLRGLPVDARGTAGRQRLRLHTRRRRGTAGPAAPRTAAGAREHLAQRTAAAGPATTRAGGQILEGGRHRQSDRRGAQHERHAEGYQALATRAHADRTPHPAPTSLSLRRA